MPTCRVGDINEKNPYFFPAIAHIILVLLIPLSSILNWLGWGYLGPKAGTVKSQSLSTARDELNATT